MPTNSNDFLQATKKEKDDASTTSRSQFKLLLIGEYTTKQIENSLLEHQISVNNLDLTEKPVEIKNNFNYTQANKYKRKFEKSGLTCTIEAESVPYLKGYSISVRGERTYYGLSSAQSSFYRYLEKELNDGKYSPSVEGNISYLYIYVFNMLQNLLGSPDEIKYDYIKKKLMKLAEAYYYEDCFTVSAISWANDCLLGMEKYEEYLTVTEPQNIFSVNTHESNTRCNVKYYIGNPISAIDIVGMSYNSKYNKFTKQNPTAFKDFLESVFIDDEKRNGSWADRLLGGNMTKYSNSLFVGASINQPEPNFPCYDFYSSSLFEKTIPELTRKAENLLREAYNIPHIGEGWISETALYHAIKDAFPQTQVIQHGRPVWLGKQHLDILFPYWKIAIEYHGKQHFEPVTFFGGVEGYEATKERDARKKALCQSNNVELIVVTESISHEQVINLVKEISSSQ